VSHDARGVPEERLRQLEMLTARIAERAEQAGAELERTRERLHKIENALAGLQHLPEMVRLEIQRSEDSRRETAGRRSALRAQWVAVGIAFGALVATVVALLVH
jgi:hypothetical protein